jgi:aryl carrier-like protein
MAMHDPNDPLARSELAFVLTILAEAMDERQLSSAAALRELDRFVQQGADSRKAAAMIARLKRARDDLEFRAILGHEGLRAWGLTLPRFRTGSGERGRSNAM